MRDFLTKNVSHQQSVNSEVLAKKVSITNLPAANNSALEIANQLRTELYDKLGTLPSRKSPKSNDKGIFSILP
jgi:hypothetical protein